MPRVPARDRYCDDKGCAELPARAHLEAHAHWGCVSPEQMAKLIDAVLTEARSAALHEATALLGGAFWFDPRDREMAMNTLLATINPPPSAVAASEPTCGVLNPKVVATCTEPQDHPGSVHRDAFGNTWPRRDGERPLGSATESAPGCER